MHSMEKSFHIYSRYVKSWKDWVSRDSLIRVYGIHNFDFAYFTNGISEAIEKVLCHSDVFKRLIFIDGEIEFFKWFAKKLALKYQIINDPLKFYFQKGDMFCWSQPFSKDGTINEYYNDIIRHAKRLGAMIFLDMAYFGTHKIHLDISLSDHVAFSLSKPLGVPGLRAGVLFSKSLNPFLQLKKEVGNAGTFQMYQSNQLMRCFKTSFNYLENIDRYNKLGEIYKLDKTDSYLFYTTKNTKHRFFQNQFIRKGERTARIPLKWLLKSDKTHYVS